jgi:hypothetical protein
MMSIRPRHRFVSKARNNGPESIAGGEIVMNQEDFVLYYKHYSKVFSYDYYVSCLEDESPEDRVIYHQQFDILEAQFRAQYSINKFKAEIHKLHVLKQMKFQKYKTFVTKLDQLNRIEFNEDSISPQSIMDPFLPLGDLKDNVKASGAIKHALLEKFKVKEMHQREKVKPSSKSYSKKKDIGPHSFADIFSMFTDPTGMKEMSAQIPKVVDAINDKLPDSSERKEFLNFFEKVSQKIPDFAGKGLGSETLSHASNLLSGIGKLSPAILVSIATAWYAHDRSWVSFSFFVGCCIYFVLKIPHQLGYLLNIYIKLNSTFDIIPVLDMEPVSPQISDSTLEVIGTFIAGSLISVVGRSGKLTTSALVLLFVKDFSRARLGMIEIAKIVLGFVEKLVNLTRDTFLDLPSIKLIDSCSKEIDEFSRDVRNYCFRFNRGTLPVDEHTYTNVSSLLSVGQSLLKSIPKDKFSDASLRMIHEDCVSLKKIIKDLEYNDISIRGIRKEPVPILLAGGPGVAKSVSALSLSDVLVRDRLNPEELEEYKVNRGPYVFSRKQENVFFDDYSNKVRVMMYDDLMQMRDVAGNPACEAMEIIRVINTEEYCAHMAHLENKGKVYIRPDYVIATTNQTTLQSNAIVNSNAMQRRFRNCTYIVVPKEQYVMDEDKGNDLWNQRLDIAKLPIKRILGDSDISVLGHLCTDLLPEHLNYFEYDYTTKKVGRCLEFKDVIIKARAQELINRRRLALHKQNHEANVLKYKRWFELAKPINEECPDDFSYDPVYLSPQSGLAFDVHKPIEVGMQRECTINSFTYEGSDTDTDDDVTDINAIAAIELWLHMNDSYYQYLKSQPFYDSCSHYDVAKAFFIEIGTLSQCRVWIFRGLRFPEGYVPLKYRKPMLPIRVFNSFSEKVDNYVNGLPSWLEFKEKFTFDTENIVAILSLVAGSGLLIVTAKWMYKWWTGEEAPQSFGFSDKLRTSKISSKYVKDAGAIKQFLQATPQFGEDASGLDLIRSIVRRNCFNFELLNDNNEWNSLGTLTFIEGRVALIPFHFVVKIIAGIEQDRTRMTRPIRLSQGKTDENNPGLLLTAEELLNGIQDGQIRRVDAVLIELPKRIAQRPSIVDKFGTRADLDFCKVNLDIVLAVTSRERDFYFGNGSRYNDVIGINKIPGYEYCIEESFVYQLPTKPGDCGSLMGILNPALQKRKIFGIHVAGHDYRGDGFAGLITQEDLIHDLKAFEPQVLLEEPSLISPESGDLDVPVRFSVLGRSKLIPARNTNTSILRSRMYGKLAFSTLVPAMLKKTEIDGIVIDPMLNAQLKYCKPDKLCSEEILYQVAGEYFTNCEWKALHPVDKRIFTLQEAIYGLENDIDFGGVSSSTSAGWPYSVAGQHNIKKALFKAEIGLEEYEKAYEDVQLAVYKIIDNAKNRIRSFNVFTDNLKDELREKEKYLKGSTRLFSGCPFDYLLAVRMYFGAFVLWFTKNRIHNGSANGVNPYSSEWNVIARELIKMSPDNIGAGDYEKFDGSQKALLHLIMTHYINRWYGEDTESNLVRDILILELCNSIHIVDGVVYLWDSGLPSGHPLTLIFNTIYNQLLLGYSWFRIFGDLSDFRQNIFSISQGDDLVYSVTDEFTGRFNDVTFSKVVSELDMVYTNESKDGTLVARRNILDIEFLKRKFKFDPMENLYIAPLRLQSILKMVDYTKKHHRVPIISQNVITAVRELSLHDVDTYNKYSIRINALFQEHYPQVTTTEPILKGYIERKTEVLATQAFF